MKVDSESIAEGRTADTCARAGPPTTASPIAEATVVCAAAVPLPAEAMEIIDYPKSARKDVRADPFGRQQKHHLPLPPVGTHWVYQSSSRRWSLEPLIEAEITVLDYQEEANEASPSEQQPQEQSAGGILEHWIRPSDTFSGICLKYGLSPTQLRRANYGFSGTNLSLAPNPLIVPNVHLAIPDQKNDDRSEQNNRQRQIEALHFALRHLQLSRPEAKCYLELNDWDTLRALKNAQQDLDETKYTVDPRGERACIDTPIEWVTIDGELGSLPVAAAK